MEGAGITLPHGDLRGLVRARRLSRLTKRSTRQNLFQAGLCRTRSQCSWPARATLSASGRLGGPGGLVEWCAVPPIAPFRPEIAWTAGTGPGTGSAAAGRVLLG